MYDTRLASYKILHSVLQTGNRLKDCRENFFTRHSLSSKERTRVMVLTNEIIRWQGRLDYRIIPHLNKPHHRLSDSLKLLLRMGTYELLMDKSIPPYAAISSAVDLTRKTAGNQFTGLINAVLRKLTVEQEIIPPSPSHLTQYSQWISMPEWLVKRWLDYYGRKKMERLVEYFNSSPSLDLRVNPEKLDRDLFDELLNNNDVELNPYKNSERFYRVLKGGSVIRKHPLFLNGTISFQNRAAGAIVELLNPKPGETVLDVCAAPGTKTVYISELMKGKGRIFASDSVPSRVKLAKEDAARNQYPIQWEIKDATMDYFPKADKILVDAPCTGTGVIGRKPDIRWRRTKNSINEMANIQSAILNHISSYLRVGGILVYGTCSLESEENWNVVEAFLKLNNKFSVDTGVNTSPSEWYRKKGILETYPPDNRVDGMFAVRLIKK